MSAAPFALSPHALEKLWGTADTAPWWNSEGKKIGEVWFRENGEIPALLIKFLFTSDKLSVQVHPDDEYAGRHHGSPGKTEMWHILRVSEGSRLAVGLKRKLAREELRAASLSGEIEALLNWVEVHPGDTIFVPAGTIHALGGGLALCEIQQPSDVTYRLYDYGRPRELHLEHSLAVADAGPARKLPQPVPLAPGETRLVASPQFITDRIEIGRSASYSPSAANTEFLIVIQGKGVLAGLPFRMGQVWKVPAGSEPFAIAPGEPSVLLRTYVP